MLPNDTMFPACFSCHVDCASSCHNDIDDQPFEYAYHPPSFDEDDDVDDEELSPKGAHSTGDLTEEEADSTHGPVSAP